MGGGDHDGARRAIAPHRVRQRRRGQVGRADQRFEAVGFQHARSLEGELPRHEARVVPNEDETATARKQMVGVRASRPTHVREGEAVSYEVAPAVGSEGDVHALSSAQMAP